MAAVAAHRAAPPRGGGVRRSRRRAAAPPPPALRPPSAALQALLLVAAAALSGFTILRGYGPHDEGLMLAWAQRVADGQWPYRDFWSNYAPGQTLVLAGLTKLFGPSLLVWRILRVAVDALTALAAFRLVRRDAGDWWGLAAWAAVAGAMAFPAGPGPTPPALLLALCAVLAARRAPAGGGVLAALAFVFRPEIGIAAAAGAVLEARSARPLAPFAIVAAVLLAPFAVVAGGDMASQVLGVRGPAGPAAPAARARASRRRRPEQAPRTALPAAARRRRGRVRGVAALAAAARPRMGVAPLVAVGVAYLLARADEFHLLPLSAALAIGVALAAAAERAPAVKVALGVVLAVVAAHGLERRAGQIRHPPRLAPVPGEVADGVRTSPADAAALRRVLGVVRRRVPPGRPVLVAPPRYDRVRVGDPLLGVLLQRPNPTRYDVMQPGLVTTAKVQREMARDLVRSRAPVVIRWLAPTAREREPNGSARSSGVRLLDRTIAARYRPLARYGDY